LEAGWHRSVSKTTTEREEQEMRLSDSIEVVPAEERDLPPSEEQMSQIYMFVQLRGEGGCCAPATRGEAEEELRRLWAL
jgi:hypothetical protein